MSGARYVKVADGAGNLVISVRKRAGFDRVIGGRRFRFAVTDETQGFGQCVTHTRSGKRVCAIAVGGAYLPAYSKLAGTAYTARANLALDALIARVGEERVAQVLSDAEVQA